MKRIRHRTQRSVLAASIALAGWATTVAVAPPDATAKTQTNSVHLRVEGANGTLEPGRGYVAGTTRTRRAIGPNPNCANRGGKPRFRGPTPIGALGLARQYNSDLNPLRLRLTDFGWQLCQVGLGAAQKSFGTLDGDFGGWLYRVNNQPGAAAVDETRLRPGDELLVYYAVFPAPGSALEPLNNGRELALRRVPARARPGDSFTVRVVGFGFDGGVEAATGAHGIEIRGGAATVQPDANGFAEVTVGPAGVARLGAVDTTAAPGPSGAEEIDIRSERLAVCVRQRLTRCSPRRGAVIRASKRDDRIRGTRGDDVIHAGAGSDVINLRPGGRNVVRCGGGRDRVILRRGTVARNTLRGCERVIAR